MSMGRIPPLAATLLVSERGWLTTTVLVEVATPPAFVAWRVAVKLPAAV
jgi:hypothetical protein